MNKIFNDVIGHPLVGIILLIGVLFGIAGGLTLVARSTANRLDAPMDIAAVESLREDVKRVDPNESEDVVGQVTSWNQTISRIQTCNDLWWCDALHSDAWNQVDLIEIPARAQ